VGFVDPCEQRPQKFFIRQSRQQMMPAATSFRLFSSAIFVGSLPAVIGFMIAEVHARPHPPWQGSIVDARGRLGRPKLMFDATQVGVSASSSRQTTHSVKT